MQSFDMGGQGSAAYDLRMFQTNTARKRKPTLTVKKQGRDALMRERARARVAMAFRGMLLAAVVVGVVVAMLVSRVQLTELSTQISKTKAQLNETLTENIRLEAEVEAKLSARNVEEYATQKLGMSTLDKSQITYIKLNEGDQVELTEQAPKADLVDQVKMALSKAKAYIFDR